MQRMQEQRAPSIVAIATKYGVIQGVLSFLTFLGVTLAAIKQNWATSLISTVLLIVLMVLAHRKFKETHEGLMRYSQGLGSGTLLSVVSAVITSVLVYVYVKYINHGYIAAAIQTQRDNLAQRGITGAQAQQAMAITGSIMTPVGITITSLIGGVIVGFIVALIVSIFTQKADPRAVI
jgi:hypothetical protein